MLDFFRFINQYIWSYPTIIILLGTHIYFTIRTGFVQRKIGTAIKSTKNSLSTLTTTLAATLGTGNIVGVASAIVLGGPGAVFWCWLTGVFGMATSYAECYLGIKYRKKMKDGTFRGGPMYVLENALNNHYLAVIFAICTLLATFGVGCTTQSGSIKDAVVDYIDISPYILGIVTAIVTGMVIIGGFSSIANVTNKLVPAMAIFYAIGCIVVLIINIKYIPETIKIILLSAFNKNALLGGLTGAGIKMAARYGVARGLFTNEAGLGSAPIAAAQTNLDEMMELKETKSNMLQAIKEKNTQISKEQIAKEKNTQISKEQIANEKDMQIIREQTVEKCIEKQALISMSATFWDTVVMCAITGIVIVSSLVYNYSKDMSEFYKLLNQDLVKVAFGQIPVIGEVYLAFALVCFAFATLIGWSFFGERAFEYLFGERFLNVYRIMYIVMIFLGMVIPMDLIWEMCDFFNILMAFPNIIALFLLRKNVKVSK